MAVHRVRQGECLASIAARHGFGDWGTIYRHPQNAELRRKRPNPHLLYPGDEVFIPEKQLKTVTAKGGQTLQFVVKSPQRSIQLDLLGDDGRPLAGAEWHLQGEGLEASGTTNGAGRMEALVPASLAWALLRVGKYQYSLELAGLDPLEQAPDGGLSGVRGRLANLGYDPGPDTPSMSEPMRLALGAFQRDHDLEGNGELDQRTLDKLKEVQGC